MKSIVEMWRTTLLYTGSGDNEVHQNQISGNPEIIELYDCNTSENSRFDPWDCGSYQRIPRDNHTEANKITKNPRIKNMVQVKQIINVMKDNKNTYAHTYTISRHHEMI